MLRTARCAFLILPCLLAAPIAGCGLTLDLDPADMAPDGSLVDLDASSDAATSGIDTGVSVDAAHHDAGPCVDPAACEPAFGPAPCGAWACGPTGCEVVCPACTDADHDGYGIGSGCAGLDCDDSDRAIGPRHVRACYGGPGGTEGVGICVAGVEACVAGRWLPCAGEITPGFERCDGRDHDCDGAVDDAMLATSCGLGACARSLTVDCASRTCMPGAPLAGYDPTCDGVDDDCDGSTDEDCTTCVWVSPTGDDTQPDPTEPSRPLRTIQRAIDRVAADPALPPRVCVTSATCSSSATYREAITMHDGISVHGSYTAAGAHCSGITTTILSTTATGVLFPSSITSGSELSRVAITPFAATSTAGVTIDGDRKSVV